jgi:hypothetical protein
MRRMQSPSMNAKVHSMCRDEVELIRDSRGHLAESCGHSTLPRAASNFDGICFLHERSEPGLNAGSPGAR